MSLIGQFIYPFTIVKEINQKELDLLKHEQKLTEQRYLLDKEKNIRSETCYWKSHSNKTIFKPFEKAPNSQYKTWVLGECIECHNYHWIFNYNFKDGHCQICPFCKARGDRKDPYVHYEKGKELTPLNNLCGKIFGDLLVNNKNPIDWGNGHCKYEVTCLRCGKIFWIRDDYLTLNHHTCCDECKKKKSLLEEVVSIYLKNFNISYTYEKKFIDMRGINNGYMSYDFYIERLDKIYVIEVQGQQHYKPVNMFGGQPQFKIQQEHDKRKRQYAHNHNFILIEIPYNCKKIEDYLIDII